MFKWLDGLADRISAALGGFLFSQIPNFISQYTERLAGHVEEIKFHITLIQQAASLSGKSLSQYVQKFLQSHDPDFFNQGLIIQKLLLRAEILEADLQALQGASSFTRPFIFSVHFNYEMGKAALDYFQIGFILTMESGIYVLFGITVGYLLYGGIKRVFSVAAVAAR